MVLGWGSGSYHLVGAAAGDGSATDDQWAMESPWGIGLTQSAVAGPSARLASRQSNASSLLSGMPLIFEPNQGQANLDPADSRVRFIARGSGYSLVLGSEGAIIHLRSRKSKLMRDGKPSGDGFESFRLNLTGANPNAIVAAAHPLPGKSNYLLGNDSSQWRRGIPQFASVRYEDIYPGINLVFYGKQGRLEYDFRVAPGANPAQAELDFDSAKTLHLENGALVIEGNGSDVRLEAPRVYQQIAGVEKAVDAHFVLRGSHRAGFAIGPYDHGCELIIDPVLSFSTYFGGTGNEQHTSVAVDGAGNIYLAGSTTSPTLPAGASTTVFQSSLSGTQNVYIAKINPAAIT